MAADRSLALFMILGRTIAIRKEAAEMLKLSKLKKKPETESTISGAWKALLFTGDNSISAFDNARIDVKKKIETLGVDSANIRQLSMSSSYIGKDGVKKTVKKALRLLCKTLTLVSRIAV